MQQSQQLFSVYTNERCVISAGLHLTLWPVDVTHGVADQYLTQWLKKIQSLRKPCFAITRCTEDKIISLGEKKGKNPNQGNTQIWGTLTMMQQKPEKLRAYSKCTQEK